MTVLIFGAGINQIELIKASKELGAISVVIDPAPEPPGKALADYFYRVNGNDYETTKAIAIKHQVNGIVTGQMEKPMRLMARLAKELGLSFHSPEVVEKSLDKWLMKQEFIKHSIPCASGVLLKHDEVINQNKIQDLNFPLIIKPRDAFSSRGVFKVSSFIELTDHLKETRSFSSEGDVIIEEFIEGREYSIETITWYGETTVIQFTKKFITPYPHTVEMAHLQPADLTLNEKKNIKAIVAAGINALGINNSAAHAEVMVTRKGLKIIEIGARLGGDFISSYLTKASTGVSMDMAAIQMALGIDPDIEIRQNRFSLIQYLELPIGKTVKRVFPLNDLYKKQGLVFAWIFVKPDDVIQMITHSAQRPALIMVEAENLVSLYELMAEYSKCLLKKIILN